MNAFAKIVMPFVTIIGRLDDTLFEDRWIMTNTVAASVNTIHPLYVPALAPIQSLATLVLFLSLVGWIWGPLTLVLRYRRSTMQPKQVSVWLRESK